MDHGLFQAEYSPPTEQCVSPNPIINTTDATSAPTRNFSLPRQSTAVVSRPTQLDTQGLVRKQVLVLGDSFTKRIVASDLSEATACTVNVQPIAPDVNSARNLVERASRDSKVDLRIVHMGTNDLPKGDLAETIWKIRRLEDTLSRLNIPRIVLSSVCYLVQQQYSIEIK